MPSDHAAKVEAIERGLNLGPLPAGRLERETLDAAHDALVSLTEERKQLERERDEAKALAEGRKELNHRERWAYSADLKAAKARLVQAEEALQQLRSAWNAHFARCKTPILEGMTDAEFFKRIDEWQNAPSNTASALRSLGDTPEKENA